MVQEKRLDYLIEYLCSELDEKDRPIVPRDFESKYQLYRSLVNIRPPKQTPKEFLEVQDLFLQELSRSKGIVTASQIEHRFFNGRILLWQGDITSLKVDAVVNAANFEMLGCFVPGHYCIDNAIHTAAGVQLRQECANIMQRQGHSENTGTAKLTKGYNLPAKHVIHTVGPIVQGLPTQKQKEQLADCYKSCLQVAHENNLQSIAFCCISTGIFSFPQQLAAEIAVDTVVNYMKTKPSLRNIIFNVFSEEDYLIYKQVIKQTHS